MAIELNYADVEATLAGLNRVAPDKRVAFRARLKHFQRLGFPPGANTGTGKRAVYSLDMLLKLAFATEFTQAGMAPKRIVGMLNHSWSTVEWSLLIAFTPTGILNEWLKDETNELVWMVSPEALRDLSEEGENDFDYYDSIQVERVVNLPEVMLSENHAAPIVGEIYRHLIIQLRPFLGRLAYHLIQVRPDISDKAMWKDMEVALVERGQQLKRLLDTVDMPVTKK